MESHVWTIYVTCVTGADRGTAETAAAALELADEGTDDPGAGGADRVTEGDRPTVDVDLLLVDLEHLHGRRADIQPEQRRRLRREQIRQSHLAISPLRIVA